MITYYCVVGKYPGQDWVFRAAYTCPILAMDKMLLWKKNWKDTEYKIVEISASELYD